MPHKRNPVGCENISGLSRIVRSYVQAAYENVPLWHERDISHSSVERVVLPDSSHLAHYVMRRLTRLLSKARAAGTQVHITGLSENFKTIFDMLGITRVATCSDSVHDAILSMDAGKSV